MQNFMVKSQRKKFNWTKGKDKEDYPCKILRDKSFKTFLKIKMKKNQINIKI